MRQPSVLIFGNGYLGNRLSALLPNAVLSPQIVHTVNDAVGFVKSLGSLPDVVINCIGYERKVATVDDHLSMLGSNVAAPMILAEACRMTGSFMIHCSSDHVFAGQKRPNEAWEEDDHPCPITLYGRTKAAADLALQDLGHVAIVRFRALIDHVPSPHNFLNRLASYPRVAQIGYSATFMDDFVTATQTIATHRMCGVYHVFNPGPFHNEVFLERYRRRVDVAHRCEFYLPSDVREGLDIGADKYFVASRKLFDAGVALRFVYDAMDETLDKYVEYRSSH